MAASEENPVPIRPPIPVGSGQLAGAGMKAKTPVESIVAASHANRRSSMAEGTRRRMKLQLHSASGTSSTMIPSPKIWKLRSAMTAPG